MLCAGFPGQLLAVLLGKPACDNRPIVLLPAPYRIWAAARTKDVVDWEASKRQALNIDCPQRRHIRAAAHVGAPLHLLPRQCHGL